MSVIVWDGESLAVDHGINDGHVITPVQKAWVVNGVHLAGVGTAHDIFKMKLWVTEGRKAEQFPQVSDQSHFVIVNPASGLIRYTTKPIGIVHGFNQVALGSGRDFAYGALAMGANAKQAAEAAAKYCVSCSPRIDVFRVML